jgi:hypothetical protein
MGLQVEKHTIRIYSYFFYEIDKPIKIEATSSKEARVILNNIFHTLPPDYQASKIVGETVSIPVKGVTKKIINGTTFIWVGLEKSTNGWMDLKYFKKK